MQSIFSPDNMRKIFNEINDGIQIVNKKGEFIYCNKRSAEIDDINIQETIGKHITHVYPDLTYENSTLLKVLDKGLPIVDYKQHYLTYKGKKIYTINTTLPIMWDEELIGAVEISNNITNVKALSDQVVELQSIVHGKKRKQDQNISLYDFNDIISNDDAMIRAKNLAKRVASTDLNVLVYGKTGTGKELLVQAIHKRSKRKEHAFIAQNCAALPSNLLEGILFGTTKGSFTGAVDRQGLFELADGGTLFLDEVNSMPLELQAKLLRVLQNGFIRRVGGTEVNRVDVRVITAMNKDPKLALEDKSLREDLYYRLNTVSIGLPDLKDRLGDVELLTMNFIEKFNQKFYKNVSGISSKALRILNQYYWPGNVRELENIFEGIIGIIDTDYITIEHLPQSILSKVSEKKMFNNNEMDLNATLESYERKFIINALHESAGNITEAAKLLGIPRQTLQYKLKKHRI